MNRFHVHVSVKDPEESIRFYPKLFGTDPILLEPGYAQCEFAPAAIRQAWQYESLCPAPSNLMEKKR